MGGIFEIADDATSRVLVRFNLGVFSCLPSPIQPRIRRPSLPIEYEQLRSKAMCPIPDKQPQVPSSLAWE